MIYEYLIFNIFVIIGPLLVFFSRRRSVVKPNLKSLAISIFIAATFFVIWDYLVVNYFWFFNSKYITGFLIANLPIEEILFFISVPFACLLLWVNYEKYFSKKLITNSSFYLIVSSLFLALVFLFYEKIYTSTVLFVFLVVVILDIFLRTNLFIKKTFISFIFIVVNILTFIFNLYLTARPVVMYNEALKTNINIITVPLEDFIFGMALISLTIIIYEKLNQIGSKPSSYSSSQKVV